MAAKPRTKKRQDCSTLPPSTLICLQMVGRDKLKDLENLVGRRFKSPALLAQAFVHHSCHVEVADKVIIQSNEKLEHYGDKVLGVSVCRYLHKKYPQHNECTFHRVLNQALSNKMFAECAEKAGLRPFLVTNRSMTTKDVAAWNNILADAFEALAGALDWDGGPRAVDKFFSRSLYPHVDTVVEQVLQPLHTPSPPPRSIPKSKGVAPKLNFQVHEGMLAAGLGYPRYDVKEDPGGGFQASILAKDELFASGKGPTNTQARKSAMLEALSKLNKKSGAPPS